VVVTFVVEPFQFTAPPVSPFPFTVSVRIPLPASTETGEIEEIWGPVKVKLFSTISHVPRP
jgi:hypothetical protein